MKTVHRFAHWKKNLSQQIFEEVDYIIMTPHFTTWNLTSWWFWLITELSSRENFISGPDVVFYLPSYTENVPE